MTIYPNKIKELPADKQAAIQYLIEEAGKAENKQMFENPTFSVKYKDYLVVGKWRIVGWEWFEIVKCKKQ